MTDHKPRHIRDIAHLYLSRMDGVRRGDSTERVAVMAPRLRYFPGFHVANIAASLAAKSVDVRVVEVSGLPASAAYFLSLPPAVYADADHAGDAAIRAISGVSLTLSAETTFAPEAGTRRSVELWHLSPTTDEGSRAGATGSFDAAIVLVGTVGEAVEFHGVEAGRQMYVDVGNSLNSDRTAFAGRVARWESALSDPVPAVLRDPDSALARSYGRVADAILGKIESRETASDRISRRIRRPITKASTERPV